MNRPKDEIRNRRCILKSRSRLRGRRHQTHAPERHGNVADLCRCDRSSSGGQIRALELRIANRDQLFSMHRRFLISSFGLFTTSMTAFVMPFLLKPLPPVPTGFGAPIARSPGNFTWETLIRAARSTAARA